MARGAVLIAAVLVCRTGAAAPDAGTHCGRDAVPWKGGCFHRYQWEPDEEACPDGVIEIPEGENRPRCVPCDGYGGRQQPMNYCAGLRASRARLKLSETFQNVLRRFPERQSELREAQSAWTKKRDRQCGGREKAFEGGSMAAQVESDCVYRRTRKRIDELQRIIDPPGPAPTAPSSSRSSPASTGSPPRRPFREFCAQAMATGTPDKVTLQILERMLHVQGCTQLEGSLGELTAFDDSKRAFDYKQKMSSLTALAYAPKLQQLKPPYGEPVADLHPLENLTDLVSINLPGSRVKDLTPLKRLTKLKSLDVRTSRVQDIAPLMDLPALNDLDIRNLRLPRAQIDLFKTKHPDATITR